MLGKQEKKRRYLSSPYALYGERVPSAGQWRSQLGFQPGVPLLLEIGCGKGDFAVYVAERYPHFLVVGLDRRADRLAAGCHWASEKNLKNVFFWHGDALTLEAHFSPGEVYELWLNYPDPYPKRRHEKHRLTHPRFLRLYYHVLAPTGRLHLRTDDEALYQYSLEQLQTAGWKVVLATPDLLPQEGPEEAHFETEFRRRKGGTIHYIQAHHPLTTE
ncbi:MAG: tRNA (guanosine(46)-N7)-methyltransferase TrmB [Bacteroidia bacterium]|jgi:tRNA (guanine-N7-)-methyltransferase|nr:tRNA (guanosine(46)-N7)-methyltransferase TrmB [Bacteroidia bacterium]GIV23510.1 MAG: hypothetical protein KatS3mg025_1169 [Bacteroidia bacterium]